MTLRNSIFSPRQVAPEHLEALYVRTRWPLLERLSDSFVHSAHEGESRYKLLVGPRGAGKSHLLALAAQQIESSLADSAVLVALGEEEHVASLLALLDRILRAMPEEEGLPSVEQQRATLRPPGADAEERALTLIDARLGDRGLVLLTENFEATLHAIGRDGRKRFRSLLQRRRWSILATAVRETDHFRKSDEPMFQMFSVVTLQPFDGDECLEALIRLARVREQHDLLDYLESPRGRPRVRAIRHLTGGSPRAMAMVFPYLTRESIHDLIQAFEELAEGLTVYFQDAMTRLSPHQRPLMECLAENWRPMSVKDVADATLQPETSVSSLLRRMAKDGLVESKAAGRSSFYVIAEPLHRIARAMKREDEGMITLARFLRHWYELDELEDRWEQGFFSPLQLSWDVMFDEGEPSSFGDACAAEIGRLCEDGRFEQALEVCERWQNEEAGCDPTMAMLWVQVKRGDVSQDDLNAAYARWPSATVSCLFWGGDGPNIDPSWLTSLATTASPRWEFTAAVFHFMQMLSHRDSFNENLNRLRAAVQSHPYASPMGGPVPPDRVSTVLPTMVGLVALVYEFSHPDATPLDLLESNIPNAANTARLLRSARLDPSLLNQQPPETAALIRSVLGDTIPPQT